MEISVVLTTYNGEKYVIKQLESILKQTKEVNEVLIFDDGSKDSTIELIDEFIKKNNLLNWKLSINKVNLGFRNNFKQGLERSKGDIVFLCDQDDIWMDNKIEIMSRIMENPKILSLASSFLIIDQNDNPIKIEIEKGKSNNNLLDYEVEDKGLFQVTTEYLIRKNYAQGCTMCVKKELLNFFFEDNLENLEHDWSLSLIASIKGGCYFYNSPLVKYRIHENNEIGLNQVFEQKKEYRNERINNRLNQILEEKKRVDFSLQYDKDNSYLILLKQYYEFRINCVKRRKIVKLIFTSIFGEFRGVSNIHAITGDIFTIIKKL